MEEIKVYEIAKTIGPDIRSEIHRIYKNTMNFRALGVEFLLIAAFGLHIQILQYFNNKFNSDYLFMKVKGWINLYFLKLLHLF